MSEFKGTKGKWQINPKASRNVRSKNITIANCSSGQNGENEEQEKANAKLIACAPEMLEALQNIIKEFDLKIVKGIDSLRIKELIKKATCR